MSTPNSILSWSGGKDASLSLYYLQQENREVNTLFTTINKHLQRITMHGVHISLLEKQVESLGCKLELISLPENISMKKYNDLMGNFLQAKRDLGVEEVVFGDIYLEDLKNFRDKELAQFKLNTHYPLWGKNTLKIAEEFIQLGFKAIVVAVSSNKLGEEHVGKEFDLDFINSLPKDVDPCGENGEFHTFVYNGPNFKFPVELQKGEITYKTYASAENDDDCFCDDENSENWDKGFWFCDLKLA